eukprot:m.144833 g.144833  ORF g.144833 m.144833 type:complete len:194 (+) comp13227_c0_seq14:5305-5886(+)
MSSDEEEVVEQPSAKSMSLRIQKKLAGMTIKSKDKMKNYVDENTGELLDHLYELAVVELKDVKGAKKLLKDLVKIVVKLGILYSKSQFNEKELAIGDDLRKKFKHTVLTMISFNEVNFTFDGEHLVSSLDSCRVLLQKLIARHLTDKSKGRVDNVFSFYGQGEILAVLYSDKHEELRQKIMGCLSKMVEDKVL